MDLDHKDDLVKCVIATTIAEYVFTVPKLVIQSGKCTTVSR